jgi:hypothetical protein
MTLEEFEKVINKMHGSFHIDEILVMTGINIFCMHSGKDDHLGWNHKEIILSEKLKTIFFHLQFHTNVK